MRWYKDMYLGNSIKGKRLYYQYTIRFTKKITGTYCLVPAKNKDDLLDIYHSELLRMPQCCPQNLLVVGIAGSWREACLLAGEIVADVLQKTGHTDVHAYFGE